MIEFAREQFLARLRLFTLGDVAGDLRGADDSALRILDRRDAERNVHSASVFTHADRLVILDAFAAANPAENDRFLVLPIFRNENRHGLADRFFGRIAKEPGRTLVP